MAYVMTENNLIHKKKPDPSSRSSCEYPLSCVIMASGVSQRFQESADTESKRYVNKLLVDFRGKPLLQWTLDCFARLDCRSRIVVAREESTGEAVPKDLFRLVWNRSENLSPTVTIRKAMAAIDPDSSGCLFAVGDQPFLTYSSVRRLCELFRDHPENIIALSWEQKRGNPVIFPRSLFQELSALEDGFTGRFVIERHPELLLMAEADCPEELMDIDTRKQYQSACGSAFPSTGPLQKKP